DSCGPDCQLGCDCDRWVEVWNLVFTQYDKTEDGEYLTLPQKNIDTGMGLERVASILQGVESNFDTDLFMPTIEKVEELSGREYSGSEGITRMAFRVIADHIRMVTFAIADGALPSNEGRGYVIRRVLRRAVRYGKELGFSGPFLYRLVPMVTEVMGEAYPEIVRGQEHLTRVIRMEEERFYATLDQGLAILESFLADIEEGQTLPGDKAFKLYDTYGFPLDLTKDVAEERGFTVDEDGFLKALDEQRKRAREARKDEGEFGEKEVYLKLRDEHGPTDFIGYESLAGKSRVLAIIQDDELVGQIQAGERGQLVLSETPFYAEAGGQVGDRGWITNEENEFSARVTNTVKRAEIYLHQVEVSAGELKAGQVVDVKVEDSFRKPVMKNHSATHLLHLALRETLGDHVQQAGSLVESGRLRFDFSHFSALTPEELQEVEDRVNELILRDYPVVVEEMPIQEAREQGVIALFGEKYGNIVRVVEMGPSKELCGGTHVSSVGRIGIFKIISEGGIAAGIRRIEAVTGRKALEVWRKQEDALKEAASLLKSEPLEIATKVNGLLQENKELLQSLSALKQKLAYKESAGLLDEAEEIAGISVIISSVQGMDMDALRKMGDQLKSKLESGIILLGSTVGEKVYLVAMVTDDLVQEGLHAGKIVGPVANKVGGGGGGRPTMAQAGGSNPERLAEALAFARELIKEQAG
ncbi:MAG: alanine--tRNA ligase, partial [Halanaerobium sp.]|nr:alanine--tRNA ligase [Halanaerobium sp.]